MNENNDLIYKQLTLHLSFDLYDNFGYLSKIKDPIEIKFVGYGDHQIHSEDIEHLLDSICTTIRSYLSEFNYEKEIYHETDRPRPSN